MDTKFDRSIKYTLINRLEELSASSEEVSDLFALWKIIEKDLTDKLSNTSRVFPYFSKHDVSHSKTLITNISLILGESRIKKLSPTDTFLLIFCSYVHDYGMAYDIEEICNILEDNDESLRRYINEKKEFNEEALILYNYYHKYKNNNFDDVKITLKDLYLSITILLEDFLRPMHPNGVERIINDFDFLLRGRIKYRFINAIITICKLHGMDFEKIFTELEYCCTGIYSDDCHPRFISAMIRLGDLLDLDNGRFSKEYERNILKEKNSIPQISKIHYLKHESITHLYVSDKYIEVEAKIQSKVVGDNSRKVANEISSWLNLLEEECNNINTCWGKIAQPDFGTPPVVSYKKIFIDNTEFSKQFHNLKMELPNDRIFSLLIGSNIYKDKYVAFREVIQNAIDATLLQVWKDVISGELIDNNKSYEETLITFLSSKNISLKKQIKRETSKNSFIDRYKIQVNVITDDDDKSVYVEVIDNGTGIGEEDLVYMSKIGGNHMSNPGINKLVTDMPEWFAPSGVFGIGLQSLFQLTDQIDFYTKKDNRTPRHIIFYSYTANKGSIECIKCTGGKQGKNLFDKISSHGTMVRFKINEKLFQKDNQLLNYDHEFDSNTKLYKHIGVEIIKVFKEYLLSMDWNYFPVYLKNSLNEKNKDYIQCIYPNYILYSTISSKDYILYDFYKKSNHIAGINLYFYDIQTKLFFSFNIPAVEVMYSDDKKSIIKTTVVEDSFKMHYKYSYIYDCQNLFNLYDMRDYPYKEMISDGINIMNLTIGIFDNDASKYLSIDRNTLKYNGLFYNTIKDIEKKCFSMFCEKLVREDCNRINENSFAILAILFARFANDKLVLEFIEKYSPYKEKNKKCEFQIGTKYIEFNKLHNRLVIKTNESFNDNLAESEFSEDIYNYFPKNFFCPYEIVYTQKNNIITNSKNICKIRREYEKKCLVRMRINSKKLEVINSLTECGNHNKSEKMLIRCLFKPWSDYEDIVVHKHPKSFSDKSHFLNIIEKNIYNYILSPFDDHVTSVIHDFLFLDKKLFLNKVKDSIIERTQLNKCINYVIKYGINKNNYEVIKSVYLKFINEVSGYIWDEYNFFDEG